MEGGVINNRGVLLPALEVAMGETVAWGNFDGPITVLSDATLTPSAWNGASFSANNDLTVYPGATLSSDTSWFFKGSTLTNEGVIDAYSTLFDGTAQTIVGAGAWTGHELYVTYGASSSVITSLANDLVLDTEELNNDGGTFALGGHTLTLRNTFFQNVGTVSGSGKVRTEGTVTLSNIGTGFSPSIEVASGTTTAWGALFNGPITVLSNATLVPSFWNGAYFTANDDLTIQAGATLISDTGWFFRGAILTVGGTLGGSNTNSSVYVYSSTLVDNGTISVPYIYFYGVHTATGTGSFAGDTTRIEAGATGTLGSHHQMSNVIVNGSLTTPGIVLDVSGDFTNYYGTYTHGNGTLRFNGGAVQNLVLNVPTTFYNLDVASGTTLVETVAADNASVAGTLTNDGVIRKTRSVGGPRALSFGLTGVSINVTTAGSLSQVQVDRIDRDHPNANALSATGRYWSITPTGAGYTLSLTLPRPASVPANALVCRNATGGWDCATTASTATTVTRSGIGELSDWAVGVGADVTTVQEMAGRWGTAAGDPGFDPLFDMDRNGVIDIRDVMLVASLWNAGG